MDVTIAQALARASERMRGSSPSADSDALELLSRALGIGRGEVHARRDAPLGPEAAARLEAWIARRLAGEPVQYITGRAAFRSLDLEVGPEVLIPRPETEGLVEAVLEMLRAEALRWPQPRVLDLGTGSGAIA